MNVTASSSASDLHVFEKLNFWVHLWKWRLPLCGAFTAWWVIMSCRLAACAAAPLSVVWSVGCHTKIPRQFPHSKSTPLFKCHYHNEPFNAGSDGRFLLFSLLQHLGLKSVTSMDGKLSSEMVHKRVSGGSNPRTNPSVYPHTSLWAGLPQSLSSVPLNSFISALVSSPRLCALHPLCWWMHAYISSQKEKKMNKECLFICIWPSAESLTY